jgi:intein-encoded DNA endonuclease-like protein
MDLLEGKKIIILEINGHNKYDNLFIDKAKQELDDLPLDLNFIDVRQFLTDQDYYVLDNHMTAKGHRKVAEAILDMIRAQ